MLRVVAADLRQAATRLSRIDAERLGSARMDRALELFAGEWAWGMARLAESVEMTGQALLAAGETYQRVDEELAAAMGRSVR